MTTCTTLPALAAPSNAASCPPQGSTSPGIARRAILARAAAALGLGAAANVAAVVATRSAPAPEATADDAELLALGRALGDRIERIEALRTKYRDVWNAGYGDRFAALTADDWAGDDDDYLARLDELQREWDVEVLLDGQQAELDALDPIERAIVVTPATTLAGLAVKARCAAFFCSHFWRENDRDCDIDKLHARGLIDAVRALARAG